MVDFSHIIEAAASEDVSRRQMILHLAISLDFNRRLDCVPTCELTSAHWDEVHAIDLASLIVGWMSDATIAYLIGVGSIDEVEPAKTHRAAGVYAHVQNFDSLRDGVYIGKSDSSVSVRINSHRCTAKTRKCTLYRAIRAFKDRTFHELLLVGIPSFDPHWFYSLWEHLCPDTIADWDKPLSATAVRATFVSIIEAAFIDLCRTFRLDDEYDAEAHKVFGSPTTTVPLNGTPGTENAVARVVALVSNTLGYRPSVDVLRSRLLNEVKDEKGGLPRLTLKKISKGNISWGWRLPGMAGTLVLPQKDANSFGMRSDAPSGEYQLELRVEYEGGFLTINTPTSEEAAELEGVKIELKSRNKEAALGGWLPLRNRRPLRALSHLYKKTMAALREAGLPPVQPLQEQNIRSLPHQDTDEAGWETGGLLAHRRLVQSLADGVFYARGRSDIHRKIDQDAVG